MVKVTLNMTEEEVERLTAKAKEFGITPTQLLREGLADAIFFREARQENDVLLAPKPQNQTWWQRCLTAAGLLPLTYKQVVFND